MYKIFSVDDHIIEPADVWTSRLPARYREAGPHVVEEDGREWWVYEGRRSDTMGLCAVAGLPQEQWTREPARFEDMIPGCYDPKARARDFLSQGVFASLSFPSLPRFGGMLFNSFADKELASLCVQAWNDFILDEWCPAGPEGMFVPMIICQVWDPKLAAAEIERCAAKGARSIGFVENPAPEGLPSFHHPDHWDPIWAVCQEADLPVSMHIASSGFVPIPDPDAPPTTNTTSNPICAIMAMANIMTSEILYKFPSLKIVFSEGGVGWVPSLLERADRTIERHWGYAGKRDLKPSELFQRNMWICMVEESIGFRLALPFVGADKIVSEMDYPHSEAPFPGAQEVFAGVFEGLPEDVVDKVSHRNAEELFHWKMADESLYYSSDVAAWRTELEQDPTAAMKLRRPLEITGV